MKHNTALLAGAAALLAACLLEPRMPVEQSLFDHVVVLDITQSMNVPDQVVDGKPASRLAYAKHALRDALLALPCGSKVGWGIFTEYRAFLLFAPIEVCSNTDELRSTLARIDNRMAWTGNSEIAKGLHGGLQIAHELADHPALVFVTDGQEAPPVNPRFRPSFDDKPGAVPGLIIGVGGPTPAPIPKSDPLGRPLGLWGADEVMQTDPRSHGRGASIASEAMVDDAGTAVPAMPGATPGREHLSSLREGYLKLLASENGLGYLRLDSSQALADALTAPSLARPVRASFDLRGPLATLALALLVLRALPGRAGWRRRARPAAG